MGRAGIARSRTRMSIIGRDRFSTEECRHPIGTVSAVLSRRSHYIVHENPHRRCGIQLEGEHTWLYQSELFEIHRIVRRQITTRLVSVARFTCNGFESE